MRFDSILDTIGKTPTIRLNRLAPKGVNLYVKVEAFNPMGSVKDRMARAVIEDAERSGKLAPGQTVVEATSGNTGIGLAMVCAAKGYPLVVVMAENFSTERRKLMRFLGAKVVLTPAGERGTGMLNKAIELAEAHDWFLCRQFENQANADAHSETTAREILEDFKDIGLDYWVTGFGTGGTLKGVGTVLKAESPDTKIAVCEPDNSLILADRDAQPRAADGSFAGSHPAFRPHVVQGWAPDFVAQLAVEAADQDLFDQIVPISGNEGIRLCQELAQKEGIFCGISGGSTLAGALELSKNAPPGSNILCMLPDTGERYLSTPLFENIDTEMTGEEIIISRSTPGSRFDLPAVAQQDAEDVPATPEANTFVDQVISDPSKPVVMFSFEYCEFCWSARKVFDAVGIPFHSVDLDSVAFQKDSLGGSIRSVLSERNGMKTIPQIYVGGEFIGGCTEMFDAWRDGSLQEKLTKLGVDFNADVDTDPYDHLPAWLHSRRSA